jgi:hypothetical protein
MLEEQLRAKIAEHLELIKYSPKALREASERSTAFLVMVAILADEKRSCEEDKVKLSTIVSASYAQAWSRVTAPQVTEKKILVENDPHYSDLREALEQCEAKISWLKTHMDIFMNGHITYRQLSKE